MRSAIRHIYPIVTISFLAAALAIAEPHPLAPPDNSSPHATLKSHFDIMGEYAGLMRTDLHTKTRFSEIRDQQLEGKDWREKGNLPFPEFDHAEKKNLEDTLDYPPDGSTSHGRISTSPEKEQNSNTKKNAT